MPRNLYQKPCRVAAGALAQRKGFFASLDAWLKPNHIADIVLKPLIELDQEVNRSHRRAIHLGKPLLQLGSGGLSLQIRAELTRQRRLIRERTLFRLRLQEEIKRVENRHFGDEIDFHAELSSRFGKDQSRQVIR